MLFVIRNVAYHHTMHCEEPSRVPNHGSKHLEVFFPPRKIIQLATQFKNRLVQTPKTNFSPMSIYATTRTTPGQVYCLTKSWQTPTGADSPSFFPSTGGDSSPFIGGTRRNFTNRSIFATLFLENLRLQSSIVLKPQSSSRSLSHRSCSSVLPTASRNWSNRLSGTSRPLEVHSA